MIDSHLTILTCTHTLPLHGLTDFSVLPSSSVAKGGCPTIPVKEKMTAACALCLPFIHPRAVLRKNSIPSCAKTQPF